MPGRVNGGQIGHRTVQLLRLRDDTYWSIILWVYKRSTSAKPLRVGDVYDKALAWFLEQVAPTRYEQYLSVPGGESRKRSLWVDSRLIERAKECAERDNVPRNRVLYTAIVLYTKKLCPVATEKQIEMLQKIKSTKPARGRPIIMARR